MSWSHYQFLDLNLLPPSLTEYRLLKFRDGRDDRFSHLVPPPSPSRREGSLPVVENVNWCQTKKGNHGHIVLYIPGHDGSYLQSRSIGAHGVQLAQKFTTRGTEASIRRALAEEQFSSTALKLEEFVMDIYTVDFGEEGGAFHASRLYAQADFVLQAMLELGNMCQVGDGEEGITIVAHSVGGLVARRAVGLLDQVGQKDGRNALVNAVITLASPHVLLPFAFESSMWNYYTSLREMEGAWDDSTSIPFLSISGGLRDELIPGELCALHTSRPIGEQAFLSSNFMNGAESNSRLLGVDHKAITWCYSILNLVRDIIHSTVLSSSLSTEERQEFIDEMLRNKTSSTLEEWKDCDYACELSQQEYRLMDDFGYWTSKAMKTAMIYNCQLFAAMYFTIGIFYPAAKSATIHWMDQSMEWTMLYIGGVATSFAMTFLLGGVAIYQPEDSVVKIALAMMAMNLYYTILCVLLPLVAKVVSIVRSLLCREGQNNNKKSMTMFRSQMHFLAGISAIYVLAFGLWTRLNHKVETGAINPMALSSHLYILLVLMILFNIVHLSCCNPCQSSKDSKQSINDEKLRRMTASLFIPILPLLVTGKLVFAWSLLTLEGQVKAIPFLKFEHDRWVGSHCGFGSCLVRRICHYDLVRSTVLICLPAYLLLLYLQHRLRGRRMLYNVKTNKSH